MANPNNSLKIHEQCRVAPSSSNHLSLPLTFFDLFWLRFHPVERIFFYSLPTPHSDPYFFFNKVVPNLKSSLSLTLQHFPPLAGNIIWPSDSETPFIQYNPSDHDGVLLLIAEAENSNFDDLLDNKSPHEAAKSRSFVPHLESSDSHASVMSLQITLIPNSGFSIGISTHHAVLDGKSSTMFIKAWASICKLGEESESPSFVQPLLDREVIKDPTGLGITFTNCWAELSSNLDPSNTNNNKRSLKILPFQPKGEHSARASFELTRVDLEKLKKRVLSMWDAVEYGEKTILCPKPPTLSTFVITCAYVFVCIAKAIQGIEKDRQKFVFAFAVDCRARLEPPIPENYFGNCVSAHIVDTHPGDFIKEDGVVVVARSIHSKTKMLEKGVLEGVEKVVPRFISMSSEGIEAFGVAGSTRFGVYETDFGWGRPAKVEISSVDRGLTIGLAESKDGKGGVEVGLVLNKHVMVLFETLFHAGLPIE